MHSNVPGPATASHEKSRGGVSLCIGKCKALHMQDRTAGHTKTQDEPAHGFEEESRGWIRRRRALHMAVCAVAPQ